jgi:membrane protein implicated in regulation of membrane protease activity
VLLIWIVLGVVLLLAETHHRAFYLLFGAIGCAAAAVVALFASDLIVVQVVAAVAAATIGILWVRPAMSRAVEHRRTVGTALPGIHGGLVGQHVVTLDAVGDAHHVGHVKLAGERWMAVSGDDRTIPAGTAVLVMAVNGTTLVVWPLHGALDSRGNGEVT